MNKPVTILAATTLGTLTVVAVVGTTLPAAASPFQPFPTTVPDRRPEPTGSSVPRTTIATPAVPAPTITLPTITLPTITPPVITPHARRPSPPPPVPDATFAVGPSQAPACTGVVVTPEQNAADVVDATPAGSTLCFAAGLHRIDRMLQPKAKQTLGSDQGAVLTGSVPLTGWTASGGDWTVKGVLPKPYAQIGQCEDNVANICHLREQVFVNGKHLKRVATRDKVVPGTFYGDYAANAVWIGDNPAGKSVEMSKTATAIGGGQANVTVRGLTVEHFASAPQAGAVVLGGGWNVFANEIRWNHAVGAMLVNADGARLEKNLIRSNGQLGAGQYSTTNGTIAANEISRNNTDGFWIADWESGGIKTTWSNGGSVSGNLIKANQGVGLWSDAYDDGRTFAANRIVDNAADGIRYEIGRNGVIEDNTITGNGLGTGRGSGRSLWDGGGINVNTSSNVTVRNNTLGGNVNGISIQSRTRGNGPWGKNVLRDVVVTGNKVTMKGGTTATGMVQNSGAAIPAGEVTLKANEYFLDSLSAERFQKFGQWFTAKEWQQAGFDADSNFLLGKRLIR
ncbi:right-handed parallel beta-helix repeat-containing protein [Kribbella lupini]|uniref:Right handed beta helix domain-containing protein n=1 Tax=Kribbella lupini TaxID=291602 RepID=A0ABN2A5I1_9ACTN